MLLRASFLISLTAWTGSLQVEAFSGCCPGTAHMNASTYCHNHIDALKHGGCFFPLHVLLCIVIFEVHILDKDCLRECRYCFCKGNEAVLTAVSMQGTVCPLLDQSVGGIYREAEKGWREATFMSFGSGCYERIGVLM